MHRAARGARYLLVGGLTGIAAAFALLGLAAAALLSVAFVVLPFLVQRLHGRGPMGGPIRLWPLAEALRGVRMLAGYERGRIGELLGVPIPEPRPPAGSAADQVRAALRDLHTYRDLGWLVLHAILGLPLGVAAVILYVNALIGLVTPLIWWVVPADSPMTFIVPISSWGRALTVPPLIAAVALATLYWGVPLVATALARGSRALLAPTSRSVLVERVEELSATRAGALDAHAAELRRIERDLHDGTQARLVTIAIQLGIAQRQREAAPELADQLIGKARLGIEDALTELREVVRSVYPPILADRGLTGAVHALAAACPVPLTSQIAPMDRLPAAVESAVYFVIAEALTNIAKHSGATSCGAAAGACRRAADRPSHRQRRGRGRRGERHRARRHPAPGRGPGRAGRAGQQGRWAYRATRGASVRVVIAEDNILLQEGLNLLLSTSGFEVTAAVDTGDDFLAAVDRDPPDIAVVDIRLPPTFRDEGLRAAVAARRRHAGLPVLVLSQYVERTYAAELLSDGQGGIGYLLKDRVSRIDEFLDALRRVAAGGTAMDPQVIAQLVAGQRLSPLAGLTPRELEVLSLMAEGHANTTIAQRLVVTERAVSKHIGNIFTKLDLPPSDSGHRRVIAVLAYLNANPTAS